MVVGNAYEYPPTHSHTQLVLKAVRTVHEELTRSGNVACMIQVSIDERPLVYRITGRRHGSTDWAWEITALERGSESDVELVHESVA